VQEIRLCAQRVNECRALAQACEEPFRSAFNELADYNTRIIHNYRAWLIEDTVIIKPGFRPIPEDDSVFDI
jgi:hypothetical protein